MSASQADATVRKAFIATQRRLLAGRRWFIDEYAINLTMTRRYARSERGRRAVVSDVLHRGGSTSVITAIRLCGVDCAMMIDGSVNTAVMSAYVEQMLAPALRRGDIVIWDNVPMHTNAETIAMIEATGARVLPLPAYSPDLNPIEECISKIKALLRTAKARTKLTLQRALRIVLDAITTNDIRGWFQHAGYRTE